MWQSDRDGCYFRNPPTTTTPQTPSPKKMSKKERPDYKVPHHRPFSKVAPPVKSQVGLEKGEWRMEGCKMHSNLVGISYVVALSSAARRWWPSPSPRARRASMAIPAAAIGGPLEADQRIGGEDRPMGVIWRLGRGLRASSWM